MNTRTSLTVLFVTLSMTLIACTGSSPKPDKDPGKYNRMYGQMVKAHNQSMLDNQTRVALHFPLGDSIPLPEGRVCSITSKGPTHATNETITYDAQGRLLSMKIMRDGQLHHSVTLTYDDKGRILTKTIDGQLSKAYIEYAYDTEYGGIATRTHRSLDKQQVTLKVSYDFDPEKRTIKQVFWPDTPEKRRETAIIFDDQWRMIQNGDAKWKHGKDLTTYSTNQFQSEYSKNDGKLIRATSTFTPPENSKLLKTWTMSTMFAYEGNKLTKAAKTMKEADKSIQTVYTYTQCTP